MTNRGSKEKTISGRKRLTGCILSIVFTLILIYPSLSLKAETRDIRKKGVRLLYHLRSFQPGEAFLIEVKGPKAIQTIEGTLFGKGIFFYTDGDMLTHYAVGGIDLHTKPGDYGTILTIQYMDGETLRLEDTLKVREKVFETHKISVDEGYVNLSKDNIKRVGKEKKTLKSIFTTTVDTEKLWDGDFIMPLKDVRVTSSFGGRRIINGSSRSPHSGLDLKAPEGTRIYASNRGKVVLAEDIYFSGKTVVLNHGMGVYTIYAHMSGIEVKEGQMAEKGDTIGRVGATGRTTGPHLHWGVKIIGSVVDPLSLKGLPLR